LPSEAKLNVNKEVVKAITADLRNAKGAVLVDYRGLNVSQDTELRAALRKAGVKYNVVKNTMVRFAARELGLSTLEKALFGPTAIATSPTDPVAPAKVMSEYAKKFDRLEIKAGIVGEDVLGVPDVLELAELPPKEALVARMVGMMAAPISGLVNVLNANIRGLAVVLSAIADRRREAEPDAGSDAGNVDAADDAKTADAADGDTANIAAATVEAAAEAAADTAAAAVESAATENTE